MKLNYIVQQLALEVKSGDSALDREVTGGYAGDLLSDVIANAKSGDIWVTIQTHQNIVAVAAMKNLSGIILVNSRQPQEEVLKKAEEENIPIMGTSLPSFELIGKLYALGVLRE